MTAAALQGGRAAAPQVSRVRANGIEIAYEGFGVPGDPPVVLVMGLGSQMLGWPDDLCQDLADRGHHVVRFDNRDTGLSTHLDHLRVPTLTDLLLRRDAPYGVDDMAQDVVGLVDALDLGPVHLVGASLGGFVGQSMALHSPQRLRSLTLVSSSTGSRRVGQPSPRLLPSLVDRPRMRDRDEAVAGFLGMFRRIGSPGYPLDEEHVRELAVGSFERGLDRAGYRRQLAASSTYPDRTGDLSRLDLPTLVVHGLHDPLVRVSGGLALARAIPGSTFVGFHGMGHDLPRQLRPVLARQIAALTEQAGGRRPAGAAARPRPTA